GVGAVHAGEELHQGRLARAVLPDDGVDLARGDVEIDAVPHAHPEQRLVDAAHPQHRGAVVPGGRPATSAHDPPPPPDASTTSAQEPPPRTEASTASASLAARSPSANVGRPSGASPPMAVAVSATKELKQSWYP